MICNFFEGIKVVLWVCVVCYYYFVEVEVCVIFIVGLLGEEVFMLVLLVVDSGYDIDFEFECFGLIVCIL